MFDIVYLCKHADFTRKFVNNIKKEDAFAEGKISIYLLDLKKETESLFSDEPQIHHVDVKGMTEADAFNQALKELKGEYVSFVCQRGMYEPEALKKALDVMKGQEILSFTPICKKGNVTLPFYVKRTGDVTALSLEARPEAFHLSFSAYIFKRDLFDGRTFDRDLLLDYETKMLCDILDEVKAYELLDAKMQFQDDDEHFLFSYEKQFYHEWYTESMDRYIIDAVQPGSSLFRQFFVLYLIRCRYRMNENEKDKSVLSPDQVPEFIEKTGKALRNIDDQVIADPRLNYHYLFQQKNMASAYMAVNFLRMKYNDITLNPEIHVVDGTLTAFYAGQKMADTNDYPVKIKSTSFDGKNLLIDGYYCGYYMFGDSPMEIVAVVNGKEVLPCRRTEIYSLYKLFSLPASKAYTLQLSIPVEKVADIRTLHFAVKYQNKRYPLKLFMERAMAKLSEDMNSYWIFGRYILSYDSSKFTIEKLTRGRHLKHEMKLYKAMLFDPYKGSRMKAITLRTLYWITKPFFSGKKIWITMDKLFKAGDNGEYLYRYTMDHKPADTEIYYVVKADSPDYARLKKDYKTVVKYASLKHRLLALNCDLMLATHVDVLNCNGFDRRLRRFFSDLYNAKTVCLAHGLTIQQIAQYQNRVFDNTELYFFASKYEVENVSKPVYDYYDKSMLKLTGHARYDGLKNNDQKVILITPTWRRGLTTGSAAKGDAYGHSDSFKQSEYYRIYNNLINDESLIRTAQECGYKILYLLHPAMSAQLNDFDKNEHVDIIAATSNMSYEKVLTESSLMVTDYSGVQFDFAYMKKPVVYYHPDSLPPQYEAGGLIYETMGFGPICKNHEAIIKELCRYMKQNCQMEELYQERVDDFFAYSDHNNSERILAEIVKFQERFEKANKHHYK